MKELYIFRIFTLFPLIGISLPDAVTALQNSISAISTAHAIVDITLSVCVLICSIGIYYAESKRLKTA
ncbi:MAG: hypothetical protein ACTHNW_22565 [Mucilaginibacter sp.]